jgi:hypothetical protein
MLFSLRCLYARPHSDKNYSELSLSQTNVKSVFGPLASSNWKGVYAMSPCLYADTSCGNREIPRLPGAEVASGRIGKSKDTRR